MEELALSDRFDAAVLGFHGLGFCYFGVSVLMV